MQFIPLHQKKYSALSKRLNSSVATFVIVATTMAVSSGTAYAGLFSFLSPIVEGSSASAQTVNYGQTENLQTLALLEAAANLDPNPNKASEIVPIDEGGALVADIANSNSIDDSSYNTLISTYVVREGDTISGVAQMFNVSINTVLWANNLTSRSVLRPGDNLIILPVSGISYTIKKGDTVGAIAKKYRADVADILNYNDITLSSSLAVGQTIMIPDAELSAPEIAQSAQTPSRISGKNYPSYPGYYMRPIAGGRKSQGLHGNNGIDLAAPVGTPIVASAAGTVIISRAGGWNGGYGTYVVILHSNGSQTLYSHMLKTAVSPGEKVAQGETIGYIGMTGRTTGPHVHFEIRGARNPF